MSEDKEWTVMVYMAGDNNLNTEMVYALEQIRSVALKNYDKVDLYAYLDGSSDEVPTLYCDFTSAGNNLRQSEPGELIQSYKVEDKLIRTQRSFNENSAAVTNIINFVNWCVKKDSPETIAKKKYAFIFSGHSFGFLNWGLYRDEKSSYSMTHSKLKYMFERITWDAQRLNDKAVEDEARYKKSHNNQGWNDKYRKERTEVVLGKKIEILGFDSCVMSSIELACQFSKFANTMVASEGSIPTAGWNYTQILLGKISKGVNTPSTQIAINFVEEFIKQQNKFALADISVDISAWDLEKLKFLEDEFGVLAQRLLDCFDDEASVVYQQMRRLLVFTHWHCQTYMLEQQIDLGDFCHVLSQEIESLKKELAGQDIEPINKVGEACIEVIKKIKDCILLTGFSGTDFQFSNGVSVFFPWSMSSYNSARQDYKKLIFIKDNGNGKKWNKFLEKYLGEASFRKSTPITEKDENGNVVSSSVIYRSYEGVDNDIETTVEDNGSNDSSEERQPPNAGRQPPNAGRQPPNAGRQPPNSGRQPPNSGRQPPNSGRMLSDLNYFLSRFVRLKNFQTGWNRAGFTSNNVQFRSQGFPTGVKPPEQGAALDRTVIIIPNPRGIQKRIDEIVNQYETFKSGGLFSSAVIDEYIKLLSELVDQADESEIIDILEEASKTNILDLAGSPDKDFRVELGNTYKRSLDNLKSDALKDNLNRSFEDSVLNRE